MNASTFITLTLRLVTSVFTATTVVRSLNVVPKITRIQNSFRLMQLTPYSPKDKLMNTSDIMHVIFSQGFSLLIFTEDIHRFSVK